MSIIHTIHWYVYCIRNASKHVYVCGCVCVCVGVCLYVCSCTIFNIFNTLKLLIYYLITSEHLTPCTIDTIETIIWTAQMNALYQCMLYKFKLE